MEVFDNLEKGRQQFRERIQGIYYQRAFEHDMEASRLQKKGS